MPIPNPNQPTPKPCHTWFYCRYKPPRYYRLIFRFLIAIDLTQLTVSIKDPHSIFIVQDVITDLFLDSQKNMKKSDLSQIIENYKAQLDFMLPLVLSFDQN